MLNPAFLAPPSPDAASPVPQLYISPNSSSNMPLEVSIPIADKTGLVGGNVTYCVKVRNGASTLEVHKARPVSPDHPRIHTAPVDSVSTLTAVL